MELCGTLKVPPESDVFTLIIIHAHHVLKFSYSTESSESPKKVEKMRFNYIKGNYVEISDSMSWVDWEKEFKDLNTNEQYELWVKIYSDLCNKNIPKIKVNQARRKPPWLNNEIKLLIKKKKKKEFNLLNKKWQKEIKKAVSGFEKDRNSKHNPEAIYSFFNSKTKLKESIKALLNGDKITTNGTELAKNFNEFISSVFTREDLINMPECESKTEQICPDPIFTINTVKKILRVKPY